MLYNVEHRLNESTSTTIENSTFRVRMEYRSSWQQLVTYANQQFTQSPFIEYLEVSIHNNIYIYMDIWILYKPLAGICSNLASFKPYIKHGTYTYSLKCNTWHVSNGLISCFNFTTNNMNFLHADLWIHARHCTIYVYVNLHTKTKCNFYMQFYASNV